MAAIELRHYYFALLFVLAFGLSHSKEEPGATLRPYTEAPVSYKLKSKLTGAVRLGSALTLKVELPGSHPGVNITKCGWTSPSGEIFPQGNDYKDSDPGTGNSSTQN